METVGELAPVNTNGSATAVDEPKRTPPFELLAFSWPRPAELRDGRWISEPDWNASLMAERPQGRYQEHDGEAYFTLNLREFCAEPVKNHYVSGDMRGFYAVFRVRATGSGILRFRASSACWIKRGGNVVYKQSKTQRREGTAIDVRAGDLLEIAVCQPGGDWDFGAALTPLPRAVFASADELVSRYLPAVIEKLRRPNGPALKLYTHGHVPVRAVVAVYSLILNGYVPSRVILYGENQWSPAERELLTRALPFAEIVPTSDVFRRLRELGGLDLCQMATESWYVMKTCVALLLGPEEFCLFDDDIFILKSLADVVRTFDKFDLVYMPDLDWGWRYRETWDFMPGSGGPMTTGTINTGLCFTRLFAEPRTVASYMLAAKGKEAHIWDQGFMATLYRVRRTVALDGARYLHPMWRGLPAGPAGYDYVANPCDYVSIHYAGLYNKPDDALSLALAPQVLSRH